MIALSDFLVVRRFCALRFLLQIRAISKTDAIDSVRNLINARWLQKKYLKRLFTQERYPKLDAKEERQYHYQAYVGERLLKTPRTMAT